MEKKKDGDWLSWGLIVLLFALGLSPIALALLLVKLFGGDKKRSRPADTTYVSEHTGTERPSRAKSAVKQVTRAPNTNRSSAKWLMIGGAVLALAGLVACVEPIDMMIWLGKVESYYLEDLLPALAMLAGGAAMFFKGRWMGRAVKRYAKYLAVMGDRDAVSVAELSRTLGYSKSRVEKDLQAMIDRGFFGGRAYLHMELGQLFRSGDANAAWRRQEAEKAERQQTERSAETMKEEYAAILANIRRANDEIDDPALSEQIDRVEAITARIFSAVEADPKKEQKIATFLNYYLPTTQKLLDSYAEFESAGVEGEHLGQAKQRIEATMEKIIQGFERQLDELYKADAMDVDSDIRVMETMLRRDTASVIDDFGAVQAEK